MSEIPKRKRTRTKRGSQKTRSGRGDPPPLGGYPVCLPWNADEEAIFHTFAAIHIANKPWPTSAMAICARRNRLSCRRWTQGSLTPEVLAERQRIEEATGGARNEVRPWRQLLPLVGRGAAPVGLPFTADEDAVYSEYRDLQAAGFFWQVDDMNIASGTRGLDCRRWTRQVLFVKKRDLEKKAFGNETDGDRGVAILEKAASEEGESSDGGESGNGGGSERGWISGEDESGRKRACSI